MCTKNQFNILIDKINSVSEKFSFFITFKFFFSESKVNMFVVTVDRELSIKLLNILN